ncbi:putative inactive phenolphthiocerol synthesis polyketide synthase type I Pks15 [Liolophura sinensis]|uniref:putative inactive phenolphthiocerol synthesis polyketide synthase type I Pks15 n=1 Tax=Liolophura sinensis TaxID=3198878 RepID=UPI0031580D97
MDDSNAIAIVGVGCRFPGAPNLDEFWNVLKNGENHVIEVPRDRWNVDAFYDPDPDAPGKTYVRKVGIVKDHDKFDNRLFDVNDIEASKMDPQQRFILESTFMALENGGIPRNTISGSNTGVYIGVMNSDYTDILASDMDQADNYTLTGGSASIAAARVSYVFNLLGPALAVDTACSSALIAIHLASQALQTGDCDMAICGGVNCVLMPSIMIPLSKARMVSPTGSSKAFSAEADGYARGEGSGIVILKKLADARANGDKIWAIVKTASNQDGRMASPITAPSGQQQLALLKETYGRHGIDPCSVQYIEAHGTGTPVGDPIEANSLGTFFGTDGSRRFIGSVKTAIWNPQQE